MLRPRLPTVGTATMVAMVTPPLAQQQVVTMVNTTIGTATSGCHGNNTIGTATSGRHANTVVTATSCHHGAGSRNKDESSLCPEVYQKPPQEPPPRGMARNPHRSPWCTGNPHRSPKVYRKPPQQPPTRGVPETPSGASAPRCTGNPQRSPEVYRKPPQQPPPRGVPENATAASAPRCNGNPHKSLCPEVLPETPTGAPRCTGNPHSSLRPKVYRKPPKEPQAVGRKGKNTGPPFQAVGRGVQEKQHIYRKNPSLKKPEPEQTPATAMRPTGTQPAQTTSHTPPARRGITQTGPLQNGGLYPNAYEIPAYVQTDGHTDIPYAIGREWRAQG
ncbi:hypothetical protein Bbelb_347070 [Branchiostoma belcheri]|nr:hypothetical protein Bbelb_347070 [Branchiostoma belcheri]